MDGFQIYKEYARTRKENRVKNPKAPRFKIRKPKDPIPEGIVMAAKNNPEDLARENRDLRKKVEYLEDKVAYLEKLYDNSLGYRKMTDRIKTDYDIKLGKKKVLDLMQKANAPPDLIGRDFLH